MTFNQQGLMDACMECVAHMEATLANQSKSPGFAKPRANNYIKHLTATSATNSMTMHLVPESIARTPNNIVLSCHQLFILRLHVLVVSVQPAVPQLFLTLSLLARAIQLLPPPSLWRLQYSPARVNARRSPSLAARRGRRSAASSRAAAPRLLRLSMRLFAGLKRLRG